MHKKCKIFLSMFLTMQCLSSCELIDKIKKAVEKEEDNIVSIVYVSTTDNVDKYSIIYLDGSVISFEVTRNNNEIIGIQSEEDSNGNRLRITVSNNGNWIIDGKETNFSSFERKNDGDLILNIDLLSSTNESSIYEITFLDGTKAKFEVKNGKDGNQGNQGDEGISSTTPRIYIGTNGNWFINDVDTNVKASATDGKNGKNGNQGEQGDSGLPGANGEKGEKGNPGANGVDGKDGLDGLDGNSFIQGNDAPLDEEGKTGDIYLDINSKDIYIKNESTWVLKGNLKGVSGDAGEDGNDAQTYYPCIFRNYDGTYLYDSYFKKGSEAIYNGLTPTKPSITIGTETMDYTFAGWDKDTSSVEGFTTFTAVFTSPKYVVDFYDFDDNYLSSSFASPGSIAFYTGESLSKKDTTTKKQYFFAGWDKDILSVNEDMKVKANPLVEVDINDLGVYPQSVVTSSVILNRIESNGVVQENGDILLANKLYKQFTSIGDEYLNGKSGYKGYYESYSNQTKIENGQTNYYGVSSIDWEVAFVDDEDIIITPTRLLQAYKYNEEVSYELIDGYYANNYEHSDLRKWLNNDFVDIAFNGTIPSIFRKKLVDNSSTSILNSLSEFLSNDTEDVFFAISATEMEECNKQGLIDPSIAEVTDYAMATGAYYLDTSSYLGLYWSRSPLSSLSPIKVDTSDYKITEVNNPSICVRPFVRIKKN